MNKWLELLIGLILVVGVVLIWGFSLQWGSFWNFGSAAWEFFKGGLMWVVLLVGFLLIVLGINNLKD